ncbi:MAG TPA: hypothetical protein VJ378_00970, partial [Candidatus Paceibacterota bacterium]|nr:hypothetical protein [Candidatus Paceibacterota bacterium]
MKNWTEYSPGTAKKKEDGNGTYGSFFFVIDAFSEPHSEKYPQRLLNGLTLGEHTARFAESFLGLNLYLLGKEPIWTLFSELNKAVLSEKVHGGIPLDVTGLSGASFTAANIKERHTEIIAAGDSFAAAELKNGEILMTKNQVHLHDMAMHKEIARLIEEVAFDWGLRLDSVGKETLEETREEMWNRFVPILTKARKKVMNNP